MSTPRSLAIGVVSLAACTSLDTSMVETQAGSNPAGNLDQCANGPVSAPAACTWSAWQNGNLNENQAHYLEGESIPYRLRLSNLPVGTSHVVRIEWDTTLLQATALHHALDYPTTFSRTETDANPCTDVAGCSLASFSTIDIPIDPRVANGADGISGTADDITQVPGVFTLFGGTFSDVSAYTVTGTYDGASQTSITLTFTASAVDPVLAWGGHVSSRVDWAPEDTASRISGSPYHMRFLDLDGSGGNQDRSLSAAAVHDPPTLYVIKHVVNIDGTAVAGDWTMDVTGPTPSPASFPGTESPGTMVLFGVDGGSYSVTEEGATSGYQASYSVDCAGTLYLDEVKTCTVTNTQIDLCANVVCLPPISECLEAGVCAPSTGECTYALKPAGSACGDPGDTICDNPDTCDASGACVTNHEPGTVLCREDAGECDVPEYCDAAGSCPANAFEPSGASCGNPADTVCDNPDSCDGTGSCVPNFEPAFVLCREDGGECDVPEYCDGAGSCPANAFEPAGTSCGDPSDSICDNPDTCNPTGSCLSNHEALTVLCREDAGECDVPEYCDAAGSCPSNAFEPPGSACGDPSDTICDNPDSCDATGACVANHEPTTVLCREDAGDCDVPEYCDAAGSCPSNAFEPPGTSCGNPADTVCDNPDTCDATGSCQSNFEPVGTTCRAVAGDCDVAEVCDAAGNCPSDSFVAAGTLCRAGTGECDPAEECSGAAASCPTDIAATCSLCGAKFYDGNVNATYDPQELGVAGWQFVLTGPGGPHNAVSDSSGSFEFTGLPEGDFTLCEATSSIGNWLQTAPASVCYAVHVPSDEASDCLLDFGNVCLGAGGGKTIGFWGNRNGMVAFNATDQGASALALLDALHLRNLNGTDFDPTTYAQVKRWLGDATATNMAYMLSAQLAAMELNVDKGFVDPTQLIYAPHTLSANALGFATLADVLTEANTELGLHGATPATSRYRAYQEALKTALDQANNNLGFLQPGACSTRFGAVTSLQSSATIKTL